MSEVASLDDLRPPSREPHMLLHAGRVLVSLDPADASTLATELGRIQDMRVDLGLVTDSAWLRCSVLLGILAAAARQPLTTPTWVPYLGTTRVEAPAREVTA